jgi:hypothetical protein
MTHCAYPHPSSMKSINAVSRLTGAVLPFLFLQLSFADPLHKAPGDASSWQHADSGWLFPRQVNDLTRLAPPYTIDGNNDVGARYERVANGRRVTATVEIYAADSAAAEANLENARSALERDAANTVAQPETPFAVENTQITAGIRITRISAPGSAPSQATLYFFQSPSWTVKIRTAADTPDERVAKELDEFVRAQHWERLGTDAGIH